MKKMKKILEAILDLVYPPHCVVCDRIVPPGRHICTDCMPVPKLITPPWCMKCGRKLYEDEPICTQCRKTEHAFTRGRALYEYRSVAESLYRLKYQGRQEYATYYGQQMATYLEDFIRNVNPDCLIPIPLHKKRMKKRGYNQAYLLAKNIEKATGIPVESKVLLRQKSTVPQKDLSLPERQKNLKKAFIVNGNDVKFKTTILIDDIYTTGSTIDEAAHALLDAGAREVYFLTLAGPTGEIK